MTQANRVSQKKYICAGCNKVIPKKRSYIEDVKRTDGEYSVKRYHPHCKP